MTAPPKSPASACPYCKGAINPELLRSGGNCPHCMLEIPGEEAPTDPGLEQKKKIAEVNLALERKRRQRAQLRNAILVLLLLMLGSVGYWRMREAQEQLVYELEDVYMAPRDGMISYKEVPAHTPTPEKSGGKKTATARRDPTLPDPGKLPDLPSGEVKPEASGEPTVRFKAPQGNNTDAAAVGFTSGTGRSSLEDVDIQVRRTNTITLDDDEEILAMAKEVTSAYAPQIEACVASKLKADPEYKGAWKVNFTIMPEGTVGKLVTKALEGEDADVEACIKRKIGSWRFQPISHEFKVGKTYRFSGQAW